ncbi:uncharacterized protein LOC125220411 [Salvia hispanica]|uniref:uncharacterized protein LOC125220411 n=1 Tax=Salvia hispanica TaxID=49212 RepID=UPI002009A586|nr:uncharacterized protein LOC125220411 [Salvia hispanica]
MVNGKTSSDLVLQSVMDVVRDHQFNVLCLILVCLRYNGKGHGKHGTYRSRYTFVSRIPGQLRYINRLVRVNDRVCLDNLRVDRNAFARLCIMLRETGELADGRYVSIEQQVAMFLGILAHHKKNRVVKFEFWRSGYTVSKYFHAVLKAVLKLHRTFLVVPDAVSEHCDDNRWNWFQGCLGAIDGTYINVHVPIGDKPRYRSRKGQVCTNTLAARDRQMRFVYVLAGWEVTRPNGFRVPKGTNMVDEDKHQNMCGNYYLCDNGYANANGFLAPYKSVRYHLQEWGIGTEAPQNERELFNMRHSRARNITERAFAVLKMRWGILRSACYYPLTIQNNIILACFLLHNYARSAMPFDPIEQSIHGGEDHLDEDVGVNVEDDGGAVEYVENVEPTNEWTAMRDELATSMWHAYVNHGV